MCEHDFDKSTLFFKVALITHWIELDFTIAFDRSCKGMQKYILSKIQQQQFTQHYLLSQKTLLFTGRLVVATIQ